MHTLPTGTVTFLFTDIEGSTKLWEAHPEPMRFALAAHDALLHTAITNAGGVVFKTVGDAFCAAFTLAPDALDATMAAQLALQNEVWPEDAPLRVRMALHTGIAQERDRDYFGPVLNRVARLLAAGHGGQMLMSAPTYELVRDHVPVGCDLKNLGSHRLKDLERPEQIYQVLSPDLPDVFPPLRTLDTSPNNLPQQLTSFIGREKALVAVRAHLGKTRLLTLTGVGGSGKSRLSLQAAADVLDQYPDGAWLVELAPLSELSLIPQTVASVLDIKEQAGQTVTQTIIEQLKARHLLLVLDNCEHLLSACASFVTALLRACPNVRVVATSREPLGIAGEVTYRVPSLSLPTPKQSRTVTPAGLSQYEAVRLFLERAQSVKPDFVATNANAPALAQLCYRLDGIPLALELAAARIRSLSPEQINDKLDTRFRLLTGGDRSALPRQQTLRALVDWSYDLLAEAEKTLLGRLSVFAGGWSLEAAEAVCGFEPLEDWEVLDLLTSLVDKSLVVAEEDAEATRYRLLETLRQYGVEKAEEKGESQEVSRRHRDYFIALAEDAAPQLNGPEQAEWLNRLEKEHDNFRTALVHCAANPEADQDEDQDEAGLRLAGALWRFWLVRGYHTEGREQLTRALRAAPTPNDAAQTVRAKVLCVAGIFASVQSDHGEARARLEEALELFRQSGDTKGVAATLGNLGNVAGSQGDYDTARACQEEALTLFRETNNPQGLASTLMNLGNVVQHQGHYTPARELYEEALSCFREAGNKLSVANTLMNLGNVVCAQGDYEAAQAVYEEALALHREIGNKQGIGGVLASMSIVAEERGELETARILNNEALALYRELGNKEGIADTFTNLGAVSQYQGDLAAARVWQEEALALYRETSNKFGMANALRKQGNIAHCQGDKSGAGALCTEALGLYREIGSKPGIIQTLESFAALSRSQSAPYVAVVLWGATATQRENLGYPLSRRHEVLYCQYQHEARATLGDSAYADAWRQGQALPPEQAADYALRSFTP